uniref:Uncharacterized protein n=1 Tax=Rhizophora mucronata TaxID=61149 RepID=A0A2P2R3J7_RHIMU
MASLPNLDF